MPRRPRLGVALVEQPLPAGNDEALRHIRHAVPVCADESVHTAEGLEELVGLYDAVNIKLDKTGGLTEALCSCATVPASWTSRSWSAAWSARRSAWRRRSCWRRMRISSIWMVRCSWRETGAPLSLYSGSLVSPPLPELWG